MCAVSADTLLLRSMISLDVLRVYISFVAPDTFAIYERGAGAVVSNLPLSLPHIRGAFFGERKYARTVCESGRNRKNLKHLSVEPSEDRAFDVGQFVKNIGSDLERG